MPPSKDRIEVPDPKLAPDPPFCKWNENKDKYKKMESHHILILSMTKQTWQNILENAKTKRNTNHDK